jgi:hypothetical protein
MTWKTKNTKINKTSHKQQIKVRNMNSASKIGYSTNLSYFMSTRILQNFIFTASDYARSPIQNLQQRSHQMEVKTSSNILEYN